MTETAKRIDVCNVVSCDYPGDYTGADDNRPYCIHHKQPGDTQSRAIGEALAQLRDRFPNVAFAYWERSEFDPDPDDPEDVGRVPLTEAQWELVREDVTDLAYDRVDGDAKEYLVAAARKYLVRRAAERAERCCSGVPSGYVDPDGEAMRMCDGSCECSECQEQASDPPPSSTPEGRVLRPL